MNDDEILGTSILFMYSVAHLRNALICRFDFFKISKLL